MKIIYILTLVLSILYLAYIVVEAFLIKKYRKNIKCVIHVNGIRGKSTITRLIDSSLREFGYRVMCKTTGTIPTIITVDNEEEEIKRFGPANIREQVRMLRRAYKDHVDYLVIECNQVNAELQYVAEHNIIKANITVVSNVREDHIGEMGNTKEELAIALSKTTPENGYLIINEDNEFKEIFENECKKRNSKLVISKPYKERDFNTFEDNVGTALEVANILNLDKEKYLEGMSKYKVDPGALGIYKVNDSSFINGLSINDIESIKIVYDKLKEKHDLSNLTLLINSRDDRPSRTKSLLKVFDILDYNKVILAGSNIDYIKKHIKKDVEVVIYKSLEDVIHEELIFGIGNIKNDGLKILDYYKKGEN